MKKNYREINNSFFYVIMFIGEDMKKKLIIGIILLIIIALLFYWFKHPIKNIDFIDRYEDYFDYALGDEWKLEATEEYKHIYKFKLYSYEDWTISFKDEEGKRQLLKISNYGTIPYEDKEKVSDYVFAKELLHYYVDLLEKETIKKSDSEIINFYNLIDTYEYNEMFHKNTLDLIDTEKGLSFQKLSFENLPEDSYYLEMSLIYDGSDDDFDYKAHTIEEFKKLNEEYPVKNAIISAGVVKKNSAETEPIYCLKYGKEETCPAANDLDTMNDFFLDYNDYIEFK